MQRAWTSRLKLVLKICLPILVIALCILFDQLSKNYFKTEYFRGQENFIIPNFFYFTYTVNTGAAWSFLAGVEWAQTFFKVLTIIALIGFVAFLAYSIIKNLSWLTYSLALVVGGTIGNFIDRVAFGGVTDFIGFLFGNYSFPIFNLADSFLVIGLIMLIFYFLFLDKNAVFKRNENSSANLSLGDVENNSSEEIKDNGKENLSD